MYYVEELYNFLDELSRNNNREWFHAHKEQYDRLRQLWLEDLQRMIDCMAAWQPDLSSQTARSCAYRFYRDTRFSTDKTPYKLFFSAAVSPYGKKSDHAGYYLHMGMRGMYDSGLYGGVYCPDSQMLKKLRTAIVDNIEEFTDIITAPDMMRYYPGWVGETLKTIPKGWDRNHPNADLLRLKEYGKYCHCDTSFFLDPKWYEHAAELFSVLKPFNDFLNYSIDE